MLSALRQSLHSVQRSVTFASAEFAHCAVAQHRWQSALPQPCYSNDEQQEELSHERRLAEMARHYDEPTQRVHKVHLPTPEQVVERLRSSTTASCSSPGTLVSASSTISTHNNSSSNSSVLDWREVVARAREAATTEQLSGERMLTDMYGRRHTYLRISLTERCNLRCLYCMPEEGVELTPSPELLTAEEVLRIARLFAAAGVDKIRLTGGEPTLRSDLVPLTAALAALPGVHAVGLTSNGIALSRKLPALRKAGLSLLNLSLDTLRPERFVAMTRRRGHDRVLGAIDAALGLGFDPVKVNVVVMRGVNDDELCDFVELTRHSPINVRFIEYMPFDGNVWAEPKLVTYKEMRARVEESFGPLQRCVDPAGEVAKNHRVPGFAGSVSFITSMTSAFCADCNRLRIMADGNLKVCLFGANEVSLRDALREGASDDDLRHVISAAVDRKKAAHAGMAELASLPNRAMVKIGG